MKRTVLSLFVLMTCFLLFFLGNQSRAQTAEDSKDEMVKENSQKELIFEIKFPLMWGDEKIYDIDPFLPTLSGNLFRGIGGDIYLQTRGFLIGGGINYWHYWQRKEEKFNRREGWDLEFSAEKKLFFIVLSFEASHRKDIFSPYSWIPAIVNSKKFFLPASLRYKRTEGILGLGLMRGDFRKSFFKLGYNAGYYWKNEWADEPFAINLNNDLLHIQSDKHGPFIDMQILKSPIRLRLKASRLVSPQKTYKEVFEETLRERGEVFQEAELEIGFRVGLIEMLLRGRHNFGNDYILCGRFLSLSIRFLIN